MSPVAARLATVLAAAWVAGWSGAGLAQAQDVGPLVVTDTRPYACSDDSGTQREYQAQVTQTLTAPGAVGPGGQFAVTDVVDTLVLDESGGLSLRLDDPVGVARSTGTATLAHDSPAGQLVVESRLALAAAPLADKRTEPGVVLRGLSSDRSTPIPVEAGQGVYLAQVITLDLQLQAADGTTTTRALTCQADSVFDAPALRVPAVPGAPAGTPDDPVLAAGTVATGASGAAAGAAAQAGGTATGADTAPAAGPDAGSTAAGQRKEKDAAAADEPASTSGTVLRWLGLGLGVVAVLLVARALQVRARR